MRHNEITPYQDGTTKKEQVRSMFDKIAGKYDLLNRVLTGGIDTQWRKKAIQHALMDRPKHVLDIATGTGDLAIMVARNSPDTTVVGLDLSSNMLSYARKKAAQRNFKIPIDFVQGDSENLPFPDNTFDAITVGFGVRNFEDTIKGLQECYRVLKPSGKMTILEFSRPTLTPFKQLYLLYFKYILPMVGKMTSKDDRAYKYLFESSQAFPAGTDFVKVLETAGFHSTFLQPLTFGICTLYSGKK
jgi:demethylmenaquinone methyltransferase/2-methoxy-6-polyprenyl-1,4-benzoquinol methylase